MFLYCIKGVDHLGHLIIREKQMNPDPHIEKGHEFIKNSYQKNTPEEENDKNAT
jgi:hypothetical protein